jgi:hypothetical protein
LRQRNGYCTAKPPACAWCASLTPARVNANWCAPCAGVRAVRRRCPRLRLKPVLEDSSSRGTALSRKHQESTHDRCGAKTGIGTATHRSLTLRAHQSGGTVESNRASQFWWWTACAFAHGDPVELSSRFESGNPSSRSRLRIARAGKLANLAYIIHYIVRYVSTLPKVRMSKSQAK